MKSKKKGVPELDFEAIKKRCNRAYFQGLRETNLLIHGREDYVKACWDWLYQRKGE